jgi:uncharacterized protein YqeY
MSLHQQIKGEIKTAMMAKDAVKLSVVRGLSAAFMNELVAQSTTKTELNDEEALMIIRRAVKQRKDSIEQFRKGKREDLASAEEAELKILETYLPQMMSKDDIKKIAEVKKKEMGVTDKAKMGQFIGALMKDLKGKADGADVKQVVEGLFIDH